MTRMNSKFNSIKHLRCIGKKNHSTVAIQNDFVLNQNNSPLEEALQGYNIALAQERDADVDYVEQAILNTNIAKEHLDSTIALSKILK